MTKGTMFNKEITPKNDYKEIFTGDNKMFVNEDKTVCYTNDEIICLSKINNLDSVLDIYAKLLELTIHGERMYKELILSKGHIESTARFTEIFCKKYNISRLTFLRALNELRARGIVTTVQIGNNQNINVVESYNIYNSIESSKALLIII